MCLCVKRTGAVFCCFELFIKLLLDDFRSLITVDLWPRNVMYMMFMRLTIVPHFYIH